MFKKNPKKFSTFFLYLLIYIHYLCLQLSRLIKNKFIIIKLLNYSIL